MNNVTMLGLGAMGSRMAARLLAAGKTVTVWNRTASAADALVAAGAARALTPRAAVAGADVVIAMLRDDAASRAVWLDPQQGALVAMGQGSIAIESSTLSPDWARELDGQVRAHGASLLEAPVSGSRVHAEAGQLAYLVGGDGSVFARCQALLMLMGASAQHIGKVGDGALCKLATNAMLGVQVTALAEVIALLARQGVQVDKVLAAMAATPVWSPVAGYLSASMISADFAPQFPVALIEKDFGYTLQLAGAAQHAPTLASAHQVFLDALAQGLGEENMTSVIKLLPALPH